MKKGKVIISLGVIIIIAVCSVVFFKNSSEGKQGAFKDKSDTLATNELKEKQDNKNSKDSSGETHEKDKSTKDEKNKSTKDEKDKSTKDEKDKSNVVKPLKVVGQPTVSNYIKKYSKSDDRGTIIISNHNKSGNLKYLEHKEDNKKEDNKKVDSKKEDNKKEDNKKVDNKKDDNKKDDNKKDDSKKDNDKKDDNSNDSENSGKYKLSNITFVKVDEKEYKSKEILKGSLFGSNLTSGNIIIKLLRNNEEIKTNIDITNSTEKKIDFSIVLPENNTYNNEEYTLIFQNQDITSSKIIKIQVKPSENNIHMNVEKLNVLVDNMSSKGGLNPISISGFNLDPKKIELKLFKNNHYIDSKIELEYEDKSTIKYMVDILENTTDKYIDYKIQLKYDNKVMSKDFKQLPAKINSNELGMKVKHVIIDESLKNINIEFDKEIDVLRNNIKEYIGISRNFKSSLKGEVLGNYEKLSNDDSVRIDGKRVLINLNKPFDNLVNKRIKLREGAFKAKDGKYSYEYECFINKDSESHYESLVLNKSIFDSKGGTVVATLRGRNLTQLKEIKQDKTGNFIRIGTVAKIKKSTDNKLLDEINCEVKGEGEEQSITFKVPENKTNRTISYVLRISLDGGNTFVDQSIYSSDRADSAVISVLPEGVSKDEKTLSNMVIHSYGPNKDGDLTKTSCSINQESKKTQVGIYGTNLEKWTTKFKLVDEKGVEWPILSNPGNDSSDFPTMVLHWNGIIGEGNYQWAEIILPNNIDNEPEFTYYVAVDGKNFDNNITVKANVPKGLNGTPNRFRSKIVDLTIRAIDENGKEIYTKSKKGYHWFIYQLLTKKELESKTNETLEGKLGHELEIPEISGYEYDPKATNRDDLEGQYGEDGKVVTLVYKNKSKVEKPKEDNLANINFVKVDEKEYNSKEILKGSLFGTNLTEGNVIVKLLKNNKQIDTNINIINSTDKKLDFSINLPANNTFNNEEYALVFADKNNTNLETRKINVLPIVKIENISFTTENLSSNSKQIIANIIGDNIENENISIKLLKDDVLTNIEAIVTKDSQYRIIFPIIKNDSHKNIKYTIRISNGYNTIDKDITQLAE